MINYDKKLTELGIELPEAPKPLGSYVAASQAGSLVFISGMLPLSGGALVRTGKFGADIDADEGVELARLCALNGLAVLKDHLGGSLDRVSKCVKITGYIASAPGFNSQPAVINGASDLMVEVFGDAGRHARAAVGSSELPLDAPLEITFIFELSS